MALRYCTYLFINILFCSICIAQSLNDTLVSKYHFNTDYPYWNDTTTKKPYHPDSLLKLAAKQIGTPYLDNGKEPGGFDCSGFTFYVFKHFDIILPYYSFQQAELGRKVLTTEAKKGDLVLFKGHDLTADHAGHIGIVAEVVKNKIKFIHASSSKGIRYDFIDSPYFKERFLMIKRIVE